MHTLLAGTIMVLQAAGIVVLLLLIPLGIGYLMKRFHTEHPLSAHASGVRLYDSRSGTDRRSHH